MFPRTFPIQTSKPASARMNPRLSLRRLVSQFVEEQRKPCWRKTTGREMLPEGGRVGGREGKGEGREEGWEEEERKGGGGREGGKERGGRRSEEGKGGEGEEGEGREL